jgi:hypothetical protein
MSFAESGFPDFEGLKRTRRRYVKEVLGLLLKHGKGFSFSELLKSLRIPPEKKSSLYNNLMVLQKLNFIGRVKRGPIQLKFKTPLCFVADTPNVPYAYLGLLGTRDGRRISETETAVKALGGLRISFKKVVVVTTQKAIGSWSGAIDPSLNIEWHTLSEDELNRVERVEERVKPKVAELMKEYVLIMDCTSGPRPAGIAFYRLASKYKIPLIYVYEPQGELIWLISKRDLERELGQLFVLSQPRAADAH